MTEYISRDSVLALIQDSRDVCANPTRELAFIREDINALPAADVREVKRVRWRTPIGEPNNYYVCDQCGWGIVGNKTNYCPNCGADMREEQT